MSLSLLGGGTIRGKQWRLGVTGPVCCPAGNTQSDAAKDQFASAAKRRFPRLPLTLQTLDETTGRGTARPKIARAKVESALAAADPVCVAECGARVSPESDVFKCNQAVFVCGIKARLMY